MPARLFLLPIVSAVLFACEGTSNKTANLMLDNPIRDRQISSFDQSTLFVDITVNGGSIQTFFVPRGDSPAVGVAGILPQTTNTMDIRWYEELDGVEINLSTQTQSFFSGGDIIINAAHNSDQFDDDNDGVSNLQERINGTCVWDSTVDCSATQSDIGPDVFITSAFAQNGILVDESFVDGASRAIVSDDFSSGIINWSSNDPIQQRSGAMCVDFLGGGPTGVQDLLAYYTGGLFSMDPGTYVMQYDLRVDTRSMPLTIGITYNAPEFINIFDHYVQGTQQWTTFTIQFENNVDIIDDANMGIFALQSPFDTTYCIDNFLLVKL